MRRLSELPSARAARRILGYYPLGSEVDVTDYLREACALGRTVALPRVEGDALVLHRWEPWDELTVGLHGQHEPLETSPLVDADDIDLVLVPGVGFDEEGHRLGFGRGFYDRLLQGFARERRVGVAFDAQVVARLSPEPHDVPMGWVVTPSRALRFQETG